jgi:hypothetical protein
MMIAIFGLAGALHPVIYRELRGTSDGLPPVTGTADYIGQR